MSRRLPRLTSLVVLAFAPALVAAVPLRTVALSGDAAEGATDAVFDSFGSTTVDGIGLTTFIASLAGPQINDLNAVGLYSESAGFAHLWARTGSQADGLPDGINYFNFGSPVMNRNGKFAYFAYLAGPGVNDRNNAGIWSNASGNIALIAREGDQPPGVESGIVYRILQDPVINAAGQVAFTGILGTPAGEPRGIGIWAQRNGATTLVIRSGNQAPGLPAGVNIADVASLPALNDSGQLVVVALLAGTGVDNNNRVALFSEAAGSLAPVIRAGSPAPGTLFGVNFKSFFSSPRINNAGQVAFMASLAGLTVNDNNALGIWSGAAGNLSLIARTGSQAPGMPLLTNYAAFENGSVVINSAGRVAFLATVTGPGVNVGVNDQAVWSNRNGNVELVVRIGSQAPGMPAGFVFNYLFGDLVMNTAGRLTFSAVAANPNNPADSRIGIWTQTDNGLSLVVGEGESVQVAPGDARVVKDLFAAGASGLEDGRPRSVNNDGDIAFTADFTDGSSAVFSTALDVGQGANCGTCGVGAPMSLAAIPLLFAAKQSPRRQTAGLRAR